MWSFGSRGSTCPWVVTTEVTGCPNAWGLLRDIFPPLPPSACYRGEDTAKSTSDLLPPDTEGGHKKDANSLPGGNASQSIHSRLRIIPCHDKGSKEHCQLSVFGQEWSYWILRGKRSYGLMLSTYLSPLPRIDLVQRAPSQWNLEPANTTVGWTT